MGTIAAERYALALFQAAKERGEIDAVDGDLKSFVGVFGPSGLRRILANPQYSPTVKERVLGEVGARLASPLSGGLLRLLLRKSRLAELETIAVRFAELVRESKGIVPCEVTLTKGPEPHFLQSIEGSLKRLTHSEVSLKVKVNPGVLGGVMVKIRNRILDASLRTRLEEVRRALKEVKVS
jgi:F-type H+-transporting ATPase subunit delta